jgi:hypothetical protein
MAFVVDGRGGAQHKVHGGAAKPERGEDYLRSVAKWGRACVRSGTFSESRVFALGNPGAIVQGGDEGKEQRKKES